MHQEHEQHLAALRERGRLRSLTPRVGADFASNDYLGLAAAPELAAAIEAAIARGVPVGAGGSRLLRGNHAEHEALEADAAHFFGTEAALYFGSGFVANSAIFATLPQRGDLVVHDALIHASVHDGVRAGRAEVRSAAHNDAQAFDDAITNWRLSGGKGRAWIAVETLYSMDGDRAPLVDLVAVADRHDAMLVLDEAHATGVWGAAGRGLGAGLDGRDNVISLHTCGKALGVSGALVLAPRALIDFLINRCRPFIFATAPSPLMAAAVRESLRLIERQPERRDRLHALIAAAGPHFAIAGLDHSGSQILPIIVGSDHRAVELAEGLQAQGFDVRAIRPPTVPEGSARLRVALTLNVDEGTIGALASALAVDLGRLAA